MNMHDSLDRLERDAEINSESLTPDLTFLSEEEVEAYARCISDAGEWIPENMTPELEAALERAVRRGFTPKKGYRYRYLPR